NNRLTIESKLQQVDRLQLTSLRHIYIIDGWGTPMYRGRYGRMRQLEILAILSYAHHSNAPNELYNMEKRGNS
ncbi:MAG: hypothetical protein GY820_15795, partial [Gammaproteobacteria bacterium]|nr:hypothetical protein [Gammaproteobacteria bacterium]